MKLGDVLLLALALSAPLVILVAGGLWAIRVTRARRGSSGAREEERRSR